tara:strand:+ start:102 stop:248 length:147 start_codon:yes stop_codon:yes gene_type:complete
MRDILKELEDFLGELKKLKNNDPMKTKIKKTAKKLGKNVKIYDKTETN